MTELKVEPDMQGMTATRAHGKKQDLDTDTDTDTDICACTMVGLDYWTYPYYLV